MNLPLRFAFHLSSAHVLCRVPVTCSQAPYTVAKYHLHGVLPLVRVISSHLQTLASLVSIVSWTTSVIDKYFSRSESGLQGLHLGCNEAHCTRLGSPIHATPCQWMTEMIRYGITLRGLDLQHWTDLVILGVRPDVLHSGVLAAHSTGKKCDLELQTQAMGLSF